jgi:hypothetical protein
MAEFIPGLTLAGLYYREAVRPALESYAPRLAHSAALIGPGSEVLGFDTEMSADHNWGPQLTIYLSAEDHARVAGDLRETLGHELPFTFRGYPTHFEQDPGDPGTVLPEATQRRPINHRVHITVLGDFLLRYIGTALSDGPTLLDWLTIPEQKLRSLVGGAVYHDGLNVLRPMRRKLATYPHDVWLYLLSAQWQRIGQEEPFMGRAGIVGDEAGSAVIAARLVRDLMRLSMLMERVYAPYPKWFGSAFAQLDCTGLLGPVLERALSSTNWREREAHLAAAYEIVAEMHNALAITGPLPARVSPFHNRPFKVIQADTFARVIWEAIEDEEIRALPYGLGKVDQFVDSTDVLSNTARCRSLSTLYTKQPPPRQPGDTQAHAAKGRAP